MLNVREFASASAMQKFVDIAMDPNGRISINLTECAGGLISGMITLAKIFGTPPILVTCTSKRRPQSSQLYERDENGTYVVSTLYPRQPALKFACDVIVFCEGAPSAAMYFVELAKLAGVYCVGNACKNDHLCGNNMQVLTLDHHVYQMPSAKFSVWAITRPSPEILPKPDHPRRLTDSQKTRSKQYAVDA
jgi:hypothetical protein